MKSIFISPKKILLIASLAIIFYSPNTFAAAPEELQKAIEEKSKTLETINQQIQLTQDNLRAASSKSKSLGNEIKKIDYTINQLSLGIKSSEVKIEKYKLEIDALSYDIDKKEEDIDVKREAIIKFLQELQEKQRENTLMVLLKNKTLAKSLAEAENVVSLNSGLDKKVQELKEIKNILDGQRLEASDRKTKIESESKNLKNQKFIVEDQKQDRSALLTQTKEQEKSYQKQLTELEKQQNDLADQIDDIEERLRKEFNISLLPSKRPGVFLWPILTLDRGGVGRISQHFGEKSRLYRGKPHNGLDIAAPIGTPVYAADNGKVAHVDSNDRSRWQKYQYGNYVLIEHGNFLSTLYAHLSRSVVVDGQNVERGQLIGYSGSTGYSTGPHLHLGAYWSASVLLKKIYPAAGLVPVGVIVDPEDYL